MHSSACPPSSSGWPFTCCCPDRGRSGPLGLLIYTDGDDHCSGRSWHAHRDCACPSDDRRASGRPTATVFWSTALRACGRIFPIMAMGRSGLLTAFLAAFGRAIAEVGAIMIVGGNIRGYTRTDDNGHCARDQQGRPKLRPCIGDYPHHSFDDGERTKPAFRPCVCRSLRSLLSCGPIVLNTRAIVIAACGGGIVLQPDFCARARSIVVASTTSTQDSGLFGYLLPIFKQQDRHRRQSHRPGHRPGARHRPARRRRRGVRAREIGRRKIPRPKALA